MNFFRKGPFSGGVMANFFKKFLLLGGQGKFLLKRTFLRGVKENSFKKVPILGVSDFYLRRKTSYLSR